MAHLADFMPYILPLVPGCPAPLAEMTLRGVAIDFCTYAPVAQQVLDPVDVYAGQAQYDIDVPYGANVTLILEAYYDGQRMQVIRQDDDVREGGTAPFALRQAADNTFTLYPTPTVDQDGVIVLRVATRPTMLAATLDDVLLADYAYEIGSGAVARLMLMPNQLFSNPQLAPTYQTIYVVGRTNARIRAEAGFGMSGNRVRPRSFM
jgi:hypothetical protein